jgi:hypothetical protein
MFFVQSSCRIGNERTVAASTELQRFHFGQGHNIRDDSRTSFLKIMSPLIFSGASYMEGVYKSTGMNALCA